MIEVKRDGENSPYILYIDGHPTARKRFSISEIGPTSLPFSSFQIRSVSKKNSEILLRHPLTDFPPGLVVDLLYDSERVPELRTVSIENLTGNCHLLFGIGVDLLQWARPYGFAALSAEVRKLAPTTGIFGTRIPTSSHLIKVAVTPANLESSVESAIKSYEPALNELLDIADSNLKLSIDPNSVILSFGFPEPIRLACEQYLVYFGQFLKDIGINSTSKLEEQAGQVLFTITPTDDIEALDNIREALEVYLALPSSPVSNAGMSNEASRLASNVMHLQSEILRERAVNQAYQITIRAQETTIQAQQLMLGNEVMMSSLKNVTPKPTDKEDLVKGIVSMGKLEKYGIEINLGEVLRRLKAKVLSRKRKSQKLIK